MGSLPRNEWTRTALARVRREALGKHCSWIGTRRLDAAVTHRDLTGLDAGVIVPQPQASVKDLQANAARRGHLTSSAGSLPRLPGESRARSRGYLCACGASQFIWSAGHAEIDGGEVASRNWTTDRCPSPRCYASGSGGLRTIGYWQGTGRPSNLQRAMTCCVPAR